MLEEVLRSGCAVGPRQFRRSKVRIECDRFVEVIERFLRKELFENVARIFPFSDTADAALPLQKPQVTALIRKSAPTIGDNHRFERMETPPSIKVCERLLALSPTRRARTLVCYRISDMGTSR
ncbi:MAG: hypothetical protein DMG61_07325 [Acidobacteria bacterium]|nr:MAG: hypothetical protein DMG61_07325 [Acidobacteriota bacterium]